MIVYKKGVRKIAPRSGSGFGLGLALELGLGEIFPGGNFPRTYKKTDEWYMEWDRMTTSDNEWQRMVQRMTMSDTTSDNGWKRVIQQVITNNNEWQRVTKNDNGWQQMTTSDTTNEYEWNERNDYKWMKLCNIHRKTPVLESLFNKVASLEAYKFIKKRPQNRCFPVNVADFLRKFYLNSTTYGCFCT